MISREKLERHSCKCYGQIRSYVVAREELLTH